MRHYILFCFSFAFLQLVLAAPASAVDNCALCYDMNARYCQEQCVNDKSGSDCNAKCMSKECDRHCGSSAGAGHGTAKGHTPGFSTPDNSTISNEVMSCKSCVARMKQSGCEADCASSERRASCLNRCAKYKCASKCQLPVGNIKRRRRQYQNCTECKEYAAGPCKRQCGDKNRPGFIACEVSCVETKCLRTCNAQRF